MRRGIVWAVSHPDWMEELGVSVASWARAMPDCEHLLYASAEIVDGLSPEVLSNLTAVIQLPVLHHAHRPRFEAMADFPLDRALFVDSDTYAVDPVPELFDALDHYDIAACVAPHHIHPDALKAGLDTRLPAVSSAVPELNAGVLACRITPAFQDMVVRWAAHFATSIAAGYGMDQFALRVALAESPLRVAHVPNTYNFRANMPQLVSGRVRIVHAHGQLDRIAAQVNASHETRLYQPDPALIFGTAPKRPDQAD